MVERTKGQPSRPPLRRHGPKGLEPGQEGAHLRRLVGQGQEDVQLGGVQLLLPDIVPVAHVLHDALEGREAAELGQLGEMGLHGLHPARLPGLQRVRAQEGLKDRLPLPLKAEQVCEQALFELQVQLVVKPQEGLPVTGIEGKAQDVCQVPDHGAGEEEALPLPAGIGHPLPVQQVQKGQGAVVVPVEHRRGPLAVPGRLEQVAGLIPVVGQLHLPDGIPLGIVRPHVLGVPGLVALDEGVRPLHDGAGGAVVGLHQQDPGPGPVLLKFQQGLGPGRPEAVDALVLVPHHKIVPVGPGQQGQDGVLDLGGVLGLVQAEVAAALLVVGQDVRLPAEDPEGEDHLVIKVHEPAPAQVVLVLEIDRGEVHALHAVGVDLGFGEYHVLAVGDVGPGVPDLLLGGIGGPGPGQQVPHHGIELALVVRQGERLRALPAGVEAEDGGAQAVDGPEGQLPGKGLPKEGLEALLHVPGGRDRIGDGEELPGRDALAVQKIAQPGHQNGGLAAPRHRQQQHRPLSLTHGGHLLFVQLDGKGGPKFLVGHGCAPEKRLPPV